MMNLLAIMLFFTTAFARGNVFENAMEVFSDNYNGEIFISHRSTYSNLSGRGVGLSLPRIHPGKDSLVIGDVPGETLYVTGNYSIPMDIYIINDGVMLLRNADCSIAGNINILNHGLLDCDSSEIHFLQEYIYHISIVAADSSTFFMKNCTTTFNGFPINLLTIGDSRLVWENVDNKDWTTAVVMGSAVDSLRNVKQAGEWLLSDNSYSYFKGTNTLLIWYFFPDSSIVDFTFPGDDTVYGFVFDSTLGNVSGINYSTYVDGCTGVLWGMIPLAGSNITIRDSELRTTGLMFNGDSTSMTGVVNGLIYEDYVLPLQDRAYRLINTKVNTWSFYPSDSSYLEVTSSIFGECVGMGNTEYLVQSAFCDGSGGHIETTDNSMGVVLLSSMMCDVISKMHSVLFIGYSSILLGNIWATNSSVMVLINTNIPAKPEAYDTSIVFVDAVTGPSTVHSYQTVEVKGSATILSGPFNPQGFDYYKLFYREVEESLWVPFDTTHYLPVYNGTLGLWNTDGLQPGYYELRCQLFDTYGNNVEALKQVNLLPGGVAEDYLREEGKGSFSLTVTNRLITVRGISADGTISLYDVTGRCIKKDNIYDGKNVSWKVKKGGVFFLRFKAGTKTFVRKAVVF
jgi:hypothetical protein